MRSEGPELETLTRRLADTPQDFLDEPRVGTTGQVAVPALVHDLLLAFGVSLEVEALQRFVGRDAKTDRNRLALVTIAVWLLAEDWFRTARVDGAAVQRFLHEGLDELAKSAAAHRFVLDADRREELARVALARLDYRPRGESVAQATDRLSGISTTERRRLIEASRAAEQRARAVREALAKKAAQESADKWTRE
jgi:hypothetical protein